MKSWNVITDDNSQTFHLQKFAIHKKQIASECKYSEKDGIFKHFFLHPSHFFFAASHLQRVKVRLGTSLNVRANGCQRARERDRRDIEGMRTVKKNGV